jgi:hypothetical protein
LDKERFAFTAHQSISELDEFVVKIHHPALTAVFGASRRSTLGRTIGGNLQEVF